MSEAPQNVLPPALVSAAPGPLVSLRTGPDGRPVAATAAAKILAPPARVWAVANDLERFVERVPMINKVKLEGSRVTLYLGFKVSIVTAGFHFTADVVREGDRKLELRYVNGEPRDIHITIELFPADDGRATLTYVSLGFDIQSLGWLVKFFLKHHPEIQYGVFSGSAASLLDSLRRAST